MPDSIDIHRVEMWDHATELINEQGQTPYERIWITVHVAGNRQVRITLYQNISCHICENQINYPEEWEEDADKFAHETCLQTHQSDMDDWVDRFAERHHPRPEPEPTPKQ